MTPSDPMDLGDTRGSGGPIHPGNMFAMGSDWLQDARLEYVHDGAVYVAPNYTWGSEIHRSAVYSGNGCLMISELVLRKPACSSRCLKSHSWKRR